MSGGEVAAMALIDALVRQLPGALKDESAADESFAGGLLDGPHYTRPEVWRGQNVPDVLLSGHHAEIARWRHEQVLPPPRRRDPTCSGERARERAWYRAAAARGKRRCPILWLGNSNPQQQPHHDGLGE